MFANILGTANLSTSLFMSLYVVTYGSICKSPFKGDLEGPTFDLRPLTFDRYKLGILIPIIILYKSSAYTSVMPDR